MSIAFKELAGSPTEHYGPEGVRAQRRLVCAWDDRTALVEELLGDGYEFGGCRRANYPGTAHIVAMRAQVEAFADDVVPQTLSEVTEGLNTYRGFAKVTVDYELLASANREDLPTVIEGTFLTYRMRRGWETISLRGDDLQWENEPSAEVPAEAIGAIRIPIVEHRLSWRRVVRPPWTAIRAAAGAVNDAEFLGAAAGSLMFDGAAAEHEFIRISDTDDVEFAWRLEYIFRERNARLLIPGVMAGWNHQYRPTPIGSANWDRLHSVAQDAHFLYRTCDFGALLKYEE
ncbi:MAG: hypothetical protein LLF97_01910 [Planctomycetaceae bacterium]|nr:hypothetical protein [Planctomycetaceae bacterium]